MAAYGGRHRHIGSSYASFWVMQSRQTIERASDLETVSAKARWSTTFCLVARDRLNSLKNQRGVDAAEREVVRHQILDIAVASRADDIIELGTSFVDVH